MIGGPKKSGNSFIASCFPFLLLENSKIGMMHLFEDACEFPRIAKRQFADCLTLQNNGGNIGLTVLHVMDG